MPFQIDPYLSEKLLRVETGMGSGQAQPMRITPPLTRNVFLSIVAA